MILVKANGREYETFCECIESWPVTRVGNLCYGDDICPKCGYFPWASSPKIATILSEANIKREEARDDRDQSTVG